MLRYRADARSASLLFGRGSVNRRPVAEGGIPYRHWIVLGNAVCRLKLVAEVSSGPRPPQLDCDSTLLSFREAIGEGNMANHTEYLRIASVAVAIAALTGTLSAQEVKHLNPVIEKLAAGKPFIGFQTSDYSLENARTVARADIDYVYLDMEHGPMDFEGLHRFSVGMLDKAAILKRGSAQASVAIFARFAPYGREQAQWVVKQALDTGLMGVIFNGIDNPEQALLAVRNMRTRKEKPLSTPIRPDCAAMRREPPSGGGAFLLPSTSGGRTSGRSIPMATCWPS
jgi:hypothetical protein